MAGAGLQSLNIFLIVFPFVVSFAIVAIRVWRNIKEHQFAIGNDLAHISASFECVLIRPL
jgi:hypothetical protein